MTRKGIIIQGSLAAVALLAAYVTWRRPDVGEPGDVVALDVSRRQLQKLRYDDGQRWVEVFPGEAYVVVRQGGRAAVKRETPGQPPIETQPAVPDRDLRGTESAEQ